MSTETLQFENRNGEVLSGRMELPPTGPVRAYAVFAHCFTCGKSTPAAVRISRELASAGIATLRFDFTGLSESEGDFGDEGFAADVEDLEAAAAFLGEHYGPAQILVGHSLGGTAAIMAAKNIDSVRAVCTIGSPGDPAHALRLFEDDVETIRNEGEARVDLAGRRFSLTKTFVDNFESVRMEETLRTLRRSLLVMHSPIDNVVGIDNAGTIFMAAKHPKSFVSLDNADHMLSNRDDAAYAAHMIAAWASRYLDEPEAAEAPEHDAYDTVVEIARDRYETRIQSGRHTYLADEPVKSGGEDRGPNPYDLLTGALGACTAMTLRMYADRKEWPLESARVQLAHKKIHAEDCEECETSDGKVDHIERVLFLTGDLDDDQRQRMVEIADKCPVHRTLHSEVHVKTTLGDA